MSTPTPRTDELDRRLHNPRVLQDRYSEMADLARTLERDLAAAERRIASFERDGYFCELECTKADLAATRAEVGRLSRALHTSCANQREDAISDGLPHSICGLAHALTARAEHAEAEVERLRKLGAAARDEMARLRKARTDTWAKLRQQIFAQEDRAEKAEAEVERLKEHYNKTARTCGPFVTDDDGTDLIPNWARIANALARITARAERAEAEVAALREDKARLDWLDANCTHVANSERYLQRHVYWGKGTHKELRAAIDSARAKGAT